jgi:hypothetical protein
MARTFILWLALSCLFFSSTFAKSIEPVSSSESAAVTVQSVKRADKYWLEELGDRGRVSYLEYNNM